MGPIIRATFVFAFMALITVQIATGFIYHLLGGIRPKAVVAIDALINRLFIMQLGLPATVVVLSLASVAFAYLAYQRGLREAQSSGAL